MTIPDESAEDSERGVPLYVLLGAAISIVLLGILGVFWHSASSAHARAERQLASTRSQLQLSTAANARLSASLTDARKLSNRRAAVIHRADKVLGQVTPLLSAVDGLQGVAGKMKDVRGSYQQASAGLTSDLLDLSDYLIQAGDYADYTVVSNQIDLIRGDIEQVNSYASQLGVLDNRYAKASTQFETRASSFNDAVEQLKTDSIATSLSTAKP